MQFIGIIMQFICSLHVVYKQIYVAYMQTS